MKTFTTVPLADISAGVEEIIKTKRKKEKRIRKDYFFIFYIIGYRYNDMMEPGKATASINLEVFILMNSDERLPAADEISQAFEKYFGYPHSVEIAGCKNIEREADDSAERTRAILLLNVNRELPDYEKEFEKLEEFCKL